MHKIEDPQELNRYGRHFSNSGFWKKIARVAKKIGKVPTYYALVLYYVLTSADTSIKNKAVICGALGYLILPLDMVPDVIPVLGLTDDIAALELAYQTIKVSVTPEIKAKAESKLDTWFGQN